MNPEEMYANVLQQRSEFCEANDCAVKALALVTGESYEMAHYALECQGRVPRDGTYTHQTLTALEELGFTWKRTGSEDIPARTAITLQRLNWPGRYLVNYAGHVAAMVDGQVLDWTRTKRNRILSVYKIEKK